MLPTLTAPTTPCPPAAPSFSKPPPSHAPAPESGSYDEAISALNSLQTNAALLARVRKERQRNVHLNLPLTTRYLERSGMTLDDLDTLQVIHVSGTKGKGSTCAFCESVLRHEGLKTGFFSSPHLVSATERIRINGAPIDEAKFTWYFWQVYNSVCRGYSEDDRPPYFKFLTILAFNIFWREGVEVAVMEVGIGGAFDCTNIVRRPVVCGITALGLDHTSLLGATIEEIAWHKAGIMKQGVTTYLEPNQPPGALRVVSERAEELGARVCSVARLGEGVKLGLEGEVQRSNAALGLALATHFLAVRRGVPPPCPLPCQPLPPCTARGLAATRWPGRSHLLPRPGLLWCLDGAHTGESMAACTQWFGSLAPSPGPVFRVLVFNTTGDRQVESLLAPLAALPWHAVIFCTNMSGRGEGGRQDQQNFTTTGAAQLARCQEHMDVWAGLTTAPALVVPCINDALLWASGGREGVLEGEFQGREEVPRALLGAGTVEVLVTGSLHLVGGVLACLLPGGIEEGEDRRRKLKSSQEDCDSSHEKLDSIKDRQS